MRKIALILTLLISLLVLNACGGNLSDKKLEKILEENGYYNMKGAKAESIIDLNENIQGLEEGNNKLLLLNFNDIYAFSIVNLDTNDIKDIVFQFTPLNNVQTAIWNKDKDTNIKCFNIAAKYIEKYGVDVFTNKIHAEEYLREITTNNAVIETSEAQDIISNSTMQIFPEIKSNDEVIVLFEENSAVPIYYATQSSVKEYNWSSLWPEYQYDFVRSSLDQSTLSRIASMYGPPYIERAVWAVVDHDFNEVGTYNSLEEVKTYLLNSSQNTEKKEESKTKFIVGAYCDLRTDLYNNSYSIGADKFMKDCEDATVEFVIHKNNEDLVVAKAVNEVWDVQMSIMSPRPTLFKFDLFEPLTDYVDIDNPIYTKALIEKSNIYGGEIYGLTNVMMSDVLYCAYNEKMYNEHGIKTPIEYYREGAWNFDNFKKMLDDLKNKQLTPIIQWTRPFINMRYGLQFDENYKVTSLYDTQEQHEWLNFIRDIIYEKGILNTKGQAYTPANRESAFVLQTIPHTLIATTNSSSNDTVRYIPWVSKHGGKDSTYVVDYNFCVPKGAKSVETSVKLINYMIEACTEDRTEMYKNAMVEEDFKIFMDSLHDFYTISQIDDYYYGYDQLVTDFSQGKTVSQHISEIKNQLQMACDNHNKLVDEKNASGVSTSTILTDK